MSMTHYESALVRIAEAYEDEDYERYERLVEMAARRFERTPSQVEDDATDVRLFGLGRG